MRMRVSPSASRSEPFVRGSRARGTVSDKRSGNRPAEAEMYRMKRHVPQREGRPGHMSDLSELEELGPVPRGSRGELKGLRAFAPPPPIRPLTPERFVRQKEAVMREVVRSAKANP